MNVTPEAFTLWEQAKANRAKIETCERHLFPGGHDAKLGQKHICLACGGSMHLTDIGSYIAGYEAAGGAADDIWPDYRKKRDG